MKKFYLMAFLFTSVSTWSHHCRNFSPGEKIFVPKPTAKFGQLISKNQECRGLVVLDGESIPRELDLRRLHVATDSNVGWRAFEISRFCQGYYVFDRVYYVGTSWQYGEITQIAGNCWAQIRVLGSQDEFHIDSLDYAERI